MNTTCIRAINRPKESHTRGDLCCCWLFSAKTNPVKIILAVRFTFQFRNRLVKTLIDSWVCRLEGKTETKQFTCKVSNLDHLFKGNWCCKNKTDQWKEEEDAELGRTRVAAVHGLTRMMQNRCGGNRLLKARASWIIQIFLCTYVTKSAAWFFWQIVVCEEF